MRKFIYLLLLIFTLMVTPVLIQDASAQPPPPDAEPIPIDGGLSFLIAAGAAYGARKVYRQQKEEEK